MRLAKTDLLLSIFFIARVALLVIMQISLSLGTAINVCRNYWICLCFWWFVVVKLLFSERKMMRNLLFDDLMMAQETDRWAMGIFTFSLLVFAPVSSEREEKKEKKADSRCGKFFFMIFSFRNYDCLEEGIHHNCTTSGRRPNGTRQLPNWHRFLSLLFFFRGIAFVSRQRKEKKANDSRSN